MTAYCRMNYKDYKRVKTYSMYSVGYFSDRLYAMEFLTGAVCVSEFHKITKEEYDTFDEWKGTEKVMEIKARPSFGLPLLANSRKEFCEEDILNDIY